MDYRLRKVTEEDMRNLRSMAKLNANCIHRGAKLESQVIAGCSNGKRTAAVFECAIYGKATRNRKVLIDDTRKPDKGVAICLGCPEKKVS